MRWVQTACTYGGSRTFHVPSGYISAGNEDLPPSAGVTVTSTVAPDGGRGNTRPNRAALAGARWRMALSVKHIA